MSAGVNVRLMETEDTPVIVDWMLTVPLWQRYDLERDLIIAQLLRGLERGDLILTADGERGACCLAWCLPTGMFGAFPYLKLFGTDPALHGKGIGGQLLNDLERRLIERGDGRLFLLVSDFNFDGQRFYASHGYQEIGRVPDLVVSGVTELLFLKEFTSLA